MLFGGVFVEYDGQFYKFTWSEIDWKRDERLKSLSFFKNKSLNLTKKSWFNKAEIRFDRNSLVRMKKMPNGHQLPFAIFYIHYLQINFDRKFIFLTIGGIWLDQSFLLWFIFLIENEGFPKFDRIGADLKWFLIGNEPFKMSHFQKSAEFELMKIPRLMSSSYGFFHKMNF